MAKKRHPQTRKERREYADNRKKAPKHRARYGQRVASEIDDLMSMGMTEKQAIQAVIDLDEHYGSDDYCDECKLYGGHLEGCPSSIEGGALIEYGKAIAYVNKASWPDRETQYQAVVDRLDMALDYERAAIEDMEERIRLMGQCDTCGMPEIVCDCWMCNCPRRIPGSVGGCTRCGVERETLR